MFPTSFWTDVFSSSRVDHFRCGLCFTASSSPMMMNVHAMILDFSLVGGLEKGFYFSIQLGMSSSQRTNSYFSEGVGQPPSSS